jgi:hypothetical protein
MILLIGLAVAGPIHRTEEQLRLHRVDQVDQVVVLDVSDTHVALKVVHHQEATEAGEPVPCGYAGMEAYPMSGVDLVLFDLSGEAPEAFTVYAPAYEASDCMSHQASEAALTKAKARFAAVGLDITRTPKPATEPRVTAEAAKATEDMYGTLTWTVKVDGEPVYVSTKGYTRMMAGDANMVALQLWSTPSGVVGLEHTSMFNGRSGESHSFGFTPVLKLPPAGSGPK